MKRGRFDADYDRVRRKPPPPEFPENDDLFERDRAERVAAAHEDFKNRMAELEAIEAKIAAERKVRADANTRRSNLLVMMQEYQRAGVKPPFVNEDGTPRCSLSLLLQLGWSIERIGDSVATLLKPRLVDDRSSRRSNNRKKPAAEENPGGETPD